MGLLEGFIELPARRASGGTYSVMRNTASGLVRSPQYSSAPMQVDPARVAYFNTTFGGVWEFLPVSQAVYQTVLNVLDDRLTPYIDDKSTMLVRADGIPVTPQLQALQGRQVMNYQRYKLTDRKIPKITDRTIERLSLYGG